MMPVVLWTDALIGLLLAGSVALAWAGRRNRLMRDAWRRVAESRPGMAAAVVLACFVVIGLADSIHYRPRLDAPGAGVGVPAAEVVSLLDRLVAGLRSRARRPTPRPSPPTSTRRKPSRGPAAGSSGTPRGCATAAAI